MIQGKSGGLCIVRGVEIRPEPLRTFAAEMGFPLAMDYQEALDDPGVEAVILTSPQELHEGQILRAAAGKHVFCEKPLAMTGMGILTDSYLQLLGHVEKPYAQPARLVTGWKAGDVISVSFKFRSGAKGLLNSILVTPFFMRFHLFGTEAWVEARDTVRSPSAGRAGTP